VDHRPVEARAIAGAHSATAYDRDPLLVANITPSPTGADPGAARLMKLMPLVFGIELHQQPSALMLYWLTSNILQLTQQWWLGKR
jgi:membrane protein insertase Oxa1/YidC/SpoIIIJ